MMDIKIRWGDLGTPIEAGEYHDGENIVRVTPGDIKLANLNPRLSDLLQITRLATVFEMFDRAEDAAAAFKKKEIGRSATAE